MASSKDIVLLCGGGDTFRLTSPIIKTVNRLRLGEPDLHVSHINFGYFPDGEFDNRLANPGNIKGKHVVLFLSTHTMELVLQLITFCSAIKHQYGAKSLTVVQPFMAFRRQDHPEISGEFNLNRWFLKDLQFNGVDRMIVCDIHSEQTMKNCRDIGLEAYNVDPTPAYIAALKETLDQAREDGNPKIVIYAPDKGSLKRAISLAKGINAGVVLNLKTRQSTGDITTSIKPTADDIDLMLKLQDRHSISIEFMSQEAIQNAIVIIREDELDTGGTSATNARQLKAAGAPCVYLVVTHMVCSRSWKRKVVDNSPFDIIFAGDSIYRHYENTTGGLIRDVSMAEVIAHQLSRILKKLD